MRNTSARGYTLIELLISTALMLIVIGLVIAAARGGFLRMGAFSEGHEQSERALNLSARIQNDVDTAGLNMTQISSEGAGTETVTFGPQQDYQTAAGSATRLTDWNGTGVTSLRSVGDGVASYQFNCPQPERVCYSGFVDSSGYQYWMMIVTQYNWWVYWVQFGTGYGVTAAYMPKGYQYPLGTDTFTVALENGANGRVMNFYATRSDGQKSFLYSLSPDQGVVYPLTPIAMIQYQGGQIANCKLTGAPLVDHVLQPRSLAPMPMSSDGAITMPIFLHFNPTTARADGFTAFRGDPTVDVSRTASDFNPRATASPVTLTVATPTRGSYSTASLALLVDYTGNHSLLLKVSSSTAQGANTSIQATPVLSTNSADGWNGLFWSNDSDYQYIYPAGSTLIKLADPIEYRWDSVDTLFRREGLYPWSIAATGVADFQVTETRTPSSYYIHVTSRLMPDNAYTQSDRTALGPEIVDQTFAPRALNSTYHQ